MTFSHLKKTYVLKGLRLLVPLMKTTVFNVHSTLHQELDGVYDTRECLTHTIA